MAEHGFNRDQVFIAGMSAGGAMAVIMAETYPDVFSAVGVHSGLPYQSAHNVMTALSAMRGRVKPRTSAAGDGVPAQPPVRTIIFHGSADKTVNPSNAADIVNDIVAHHPRNTAVIEDGQRNGKRFTRTIIADASNRVVVENWHIEGSGHAWSGGSPSGSFTDPTGPDASAEMVRFFLA
jgi:poly(3-hydroxybutyrate) depolymerase